MHVQIAHSSSSDSSSSSQSTTEKIYSVQGETIDSCFAILNNYLSKQLIFSHCSALVLSKDLAKQDVENIFSTLANNTELRGTCNVLVSSKSSYDILSKVSNSGEGFSSRLYDYLANSSEYTAFSEDSEFSNVYKKIKDPYGEVTTIYSAIVDDNIQNMGIAVFKNNKMVGTIDVLETVAHLLVTDELESCVLTFDSPFKEDEKVDIQITRTYKNSKTNIFLINNSPFIEIDLYPKCYIRSSGKNYDYTDEENIVKLEEATNRYIESIVKDYLYTITKKYNSDIAGFGEKFTANYLTFDDFEKIKWNEIFKSSFYKVNVHSKITSSKLFTKQ